MVSNKLVSSVQGIKNLRNHKDFENYRDLLLVLVQKEMKVRYKNKVLGYLWSIASPLSSALVYFIAFGIFMRVDVESYPLVLISGLFPWQWLSNSVGSSPNLFIGNSWIIKKVNFPRSIIPLCTILNHMIHFVISIPIIVLFLFIFHKTPSLSWLYGIPILLVIQFFTVFGVALIFASINLFFRDLERLVGIIMHFLFFFTPILYEPEMIPESVRRFGILNPAFPLIISWKELFLEGKLEPIYLLAGVFYAILFFCLGNLVYKKLSWRFAEVI